LQLKPNNKKGFRIKGKLDAFNIKGIALLPMGEGDFIMALNADMRKAIKKRQGDTITVCLEEDKKGYELNAEFMECLNDEPKAYTFLERFLKGIKTISVSGLKVPKQLKQKAKE